MYGYALHLLTTDFTLARVEPGPDFNAHFASAIDDSLGAGNRPSWTVKRCVNTVACPLDHATAKLFDALIA